MSIPGMSAAMEGAGVGVGMGVLPDMSIPGMSAAMLGVGVGALPDMSIPGISIPGMLPASGKAGELVVVSPEPWSIPAIPAMADEDGLDATITNPTTALATARTTAEITIWRVPVIRVIEESSQDRRVVPVA